jgi:hypothetical protein
LALPHRFVAAAMIATMVNTARSRREFITYLPGRALGFAQSARGGRSMVAGTDQARLLGNEPEVIAVADPPRLREGNRTLIDCLEAPLLHRRGGDLKFRCKSCVRHPEIGRRIRQPRTPSVPKGVLIW